jgi:hypothetical protein
VSGKIAQLGYLPVPDEEDPEILPHVGVLFDDEQSIHVVTEVILGGNFSISAWVKPGSAQDFAPIFTKLVAQRNLSLNLFLGEPISKTQER